MSIDVFPCSPVNGMTSDSTAEIIPEEQDATLSDDQSDIVLEQAIHRQFFSVIEKGGFDVFQEIIETYINNMAQRLSELRTSIVEQNAHELFVSAHSLKSLSAQMGAYGLSSVCLELEMLGQSGSVEGAAPFVSKVETEYERIRAILKKKKLPK